MLFCRSSLSDLFLFVSLLCLVNNLNCLEEVPQSQENDVPLTENKQPPELQASSQQEGNDQLGQENVPQKEVESQLGQQNVEVQEAQPDQPVKAEAQPVPQVQVDSSAENWQGGVEVEEQGDGSEEKEDEEEDLVRIMGIETVDDSELDPDMEIDPVTGKRMYDGYRLITAFPQNEEQLEVLKFISSGVDDYWTPIPKDDVHLHGVDMLVSPKHYHHVSGYLNCSGLKYNVTIQDLQRAINLENDDEGDGEDDDELLVGRPGFCTNRADFHWKKYRTITEFDAYIDCISTDHRDKVRVHNIGTSSEGRRLRVVQIGRRQTGKAIWIDGGIHAREWISPASVMYMIHQFVENYDEHSSVLQDFDIYIMPLVNPDGYAFTQFDRMWRKTRSNSNKYSRYSKCIGTDPNRNWGYKWGGKGASQNPCSETYRGSAPFSEPETRAIEQFIMQRRQDFKLFLTYHSYGQYILYPWGYTDAGVPPNWANLKSLAQIGANAMRRTGNHDYTIGSAAQVLYPAAGGSDDWARGSAKIQYSYTIELPDTGKYGFILPKEYIDPTVKEAFAGVLAMIRELRERINNGNE